MSAPAKTLADIRSDVCNTTLLVLFAFAVPAVAASLVRIFTLGWLPVMGLHIALFIALAGIASARRQLSYKIRAGFVVAVMFLIGAGGILSFGLSTEVSVFLVGSAILAACFFGTKPGAAVITVSVVFLCLTYFAFDFGFLPKPDATFYAFAPATWLAAIMGVILACTGPLVAVARFVRDLEHERNRAEKASAAKSQFLAMMSHELRTPLTGVMGMAELLQTDDLSAKQADRVRRLSRSASSLLDLLNDLLDFSKIEAKRMIIEEIPFRMRDVVGAVRDLLQPSATEKHLNLTWTIDPSANERFVGDPTRIRQVLINLANNAIKFTESGEVTVKISREADRDDAVRLMIEVADTGIGISPEQVDRLFEPFVQADEGTTRRFGGTGLGLAISRRLVEAMGGEISVSSKMGVGSTFRVMIPTRIAVESDDILGLADRENEAAEVKQTGRVLVAEDMETTRYLLVNMLSRMGHVVEAVADGAEAIQAAKTGVFDVILMDMQMPVADGVEATKAIRALDSSRAKIPIIALTADVIRENHAEFVSAGVNSVLTKPVDWVSLTAEINRQLTSSTGSVKKANHQPARVGRDAGQESVVLDDLSLTELGDAVGHDVLATMLATFPDSMQKYRDELIKVAKAGNRKGIKSTAHALKGLCAQFGAVHVSRVAARFERPGANLEDICNELPELTKSTEDAARAVKEYIAKTRPLS
jgi:signal transduction histidine kinase/DNA-binding NarL/FixJ family response regulator/HPt (histidine-containing phosphotransfer) domain-containing protein